MELDQQDSLLALLPTIKRIYGGYKKSSANPACAPTRASDAIGGETKTA
jgi:hypothetical protein